MYLLSPFPLNFIFLYYPASSAIPKALFQEAAWKIIALDHIDSPAADLFHFFLCFHPFGNNMIIHFMKCFYNTFIENCPFLIPADIKKQRSVNLDYRKRKPHYRIQICISGTKIIQTQTNASVRKFLRKLFLDPHCIQSQPFP